MIATKFNYFAPGLAIIKLDNEVSLFSESNRLRVRLKDKITRGLFFLITIRLKGI